MSAEHGHGKAGEHEIVVLDLFCGGGGAARGIINAGVYGILGIDNDPTTLLTYTDAINGADDPPIYAGHNTIDAIAALDELIKAVQDNTVWQEFERLNYPDLIWASPPCQAYTWGTRSNRKQAFPTLIPEVRGRLETLRLLTDVDYIIENVPGAPLIDPVRLCGEMFGLNVIRHRHFECSWPATVPPHIRHKPPLTRPRRDGKPGQIQVSQYCCVSGHGGNSDSFKLDDWKEAMDIDWMSREHLIEAIPPIYAEYLVSQWKVHRGF